VNRRAQLIEAMRNNPRDWRIGDLTNITGQLGIECRNHDGSHHVFSHPGVEMDLSVPAHRPIKPAYVRQFLLLVDASEELDR
jgi:hypothetical protein